MFPLTFCGLRAQKFWRVRTFSANSPKIKAVFKSDIWWRAKKRRRRYSLRNGTVFKAEKFIVCFVVAILWSTTICLCNNMSVRSKFTRVRSLWNRFARAHKHSLEGTLTFNFLLLNWTKLDSRKVVYAFIHRKRKLKVYQTKKCKNQQ